MDRRRILILATSLMVVTSLLTAKIERQRAGASNRKEPDYFQTKNTSDINAIWLPLISKQSDISWSMPGANPQRTSWIPEGVDPGASSQFGVEWYRPIEAYIGQHFQLVAARDKIFVSTARGLYALDSASGDVVWRFDTELPLGNSPTVSGDKIYVGGFDKRVYALDADTGSLIWTFGSAKGGYSTNPLVEQGKVLLGSRDGYFYALDQDTGNLIWQFPLHDQAPLASILYSAAYKDGKVFFAANDNYAYALDVTSGSLIWQSEKMPGDGFQAWWPVIYGDYVIYSGASPYVDGGDPGTSSFSDVVDESDPYYALMHNFQYSDDFVKTIQRDDVFHQNEPNDSLLGAEFVAGSEADTTGITWSWENGKTVIDASKVTEYLENDGQAKVNRPTNKPWRRSLVVLDIENGKEYTFDSDKDGHPEYAPFLFTGTKSGNRYPPLIIPTRNNQGDLGEVLYAQNLFQYQEGWGISSAKLAAWQFGTPYIHLVGERFAIDEPFADSAGGSMLYQNLCCDRIGEAVNLETGTENLLWGYAGYTLESIKYDWQDIEPWMKSLAPGYDEMWWGASMYDYYPRLYGNYGTMNGIYHNHGLQNPIIPYEGRLFVHRSNAIIAFGPNPVQLRQRTQNETPEQYEQNIRQEYPDVYRPLLEVEAPDLIVPPTISVPDIQSNLDNQIDKILQTGHLRPGYYNSTRGFPEFANYFEDPGDTLYSLLLAYPHVSDGLKSALELYIKQHFKMYFENEMSSRTGYWIDNPISYDLNDIDGFGQLQQREWMPLPPEVTEDMKQHPASYWVGINWPWEYPQHNFYAMWLYAKQFYSDNPVKLEEIYSLAKGRLESTLPNEATLYDKPWIHNGFIAGYIGFLNLQELAGKAQEDASLRSAVSSNLNYLLDLRSNDFRKDSPWANEEICCSPDVDKRSFNIARNFLYLVPELSEYLRLNALDKVKEAVDEYEYVAPYWIATRYEASFAEFASDNLYTNHAMFQAKAYILQEPTEQLLKYIDVPAFKVGDLFYVQNLVAILESAESK